MATTNFNPTIHGYHFNNGNITWSIGFINGKFLCGGMAYSALDYYNYGMVIPQQTTAPADGTPLNTYIFNRQATAHLNTVPRFALWWGADQSWCVNQSQSEFAKLVGILRRGTPIPICLVRSGGRGHHVVAIGYSMTNPITINVYDPNYPDKICNFTQSGNSFFHNDRSQWWGFFVDDGYTKTYPEVIQTSAEEGWRRCFKCQVMYFNGNVTKGKCPAGGNHMLALSLHQYNLNVEHGDGQPDWKRCSKCESLHFTAGLMESGTCAAGGKHSANGSKNYILRQNSSLGQKDWRWCRKCGGLFFGLEAGKSRCPNGGTHDSSQSGNYTIPRVAK